MKKTALALFASFLLFGAACTSQTTVEAGAASAAQDASAGQPVTDSAPAEADAAATDQEDATTQAPASEPSNTEDENPAAAVEGVPAAETAASTSSLGSGDWCSAASQIEEGFNDDVFGGIDAESLEEAMTNSSALMNQAIQIAPPAIAADVAVVAQASTTMLAVLTEADWDFLAVDFEVFEEITAGMESSGYNIQKYNFEVCGVGEDPDLYLADDFEDIEIEELLDSDIARSVMAQTLSGFGLEEADAACVVEAWSEIGLDDPTGMITAMQQCGVPLDTIMGG